jgi:hypothetical protein
MHGRSAELMLIFYKKKDACDAQGHKGGGILLQNSSCLLEKLKKL